MRGALPLLLATLVAGCGYSSKTADSDKVALSDAPAAADANAPAPAGALAGPVLQKLDAPPYTYLLVKTTQGETWAAVPQAAVATGANVRVYNPMLMTKFESKALKRTFDELYFGTLSPDGSDAARAGGPAMTADGSNPHAGITAPASEPVKVGKVDKAAGADAYTIAEAWAAKDALNGKVIAIRGTVVKYNAQVMGKNWVHLQDGSGDAAKNTHDITVVTMGETAKGQTITIRGTVKTSKDYGAGYKYAIIIEDAKIVK